MTRQRQRGLTLVELMIALVLGLLVIAALSQVYLAASQTQRTQYNLTARQENLRFALHLLSRDVRQAGYQGCLRDTGNLRNTLNDSSSYLYRFERAVEGFEADGKGWRPALPAAILGAAPDSDVLVLRGVSDDGVPIQQSMPQPSADLKVTDKLSPAPLTDGDIVLISDCGGSAAFQITQYTVDSGNIVHNAGRGGGLPTPGNATQDLGRRYPVGALIHRIQTVAYYVGLDADGSRQLWRQAGAGPAQPIASGIERMQLRYGVDTDGNRSADDWRPADAVTDWSKVMAVRVALLVASPERAPGVGADTRRFDLLGETVGPFDDGRLRRVLETTLSLRNRLP